MTDFGGSGNGGTIAECELNLPEKSCAGSARLTSSDLNELGCTSSTSAKSTASSSGIGTASCRRSSNTNPHQFVCNGQRTARSQSKLSVLSVFRSNPPNARNRVLKQQKRVRTSSKSSIFLHILKALTGGFASCSKKSRADDDDSSRRDSNTCSNSDGMSDVANNLELLTAPYANGQGHRRKSHDGSHDGTNGSDSTSTGYVSDSSNEKHYPKNPPTEAPTIEVVPEAPEEPLEALKSDENTKESTKGSSASYELVDLELGENFCYVASSASEEEVTGTEESLYTSGTESGSSDYETNETSSYEDEFNSDDKDSKSSGKRKTLDIIIEETEEPERAEKRGIKRRKSTIKRKRTLKDNDLKSGMKSKLASLRDDLRMKEEDAVSRTGSLKDMILQFETAVAALEIGDMIEPHVSVNHVPVAQPTPCSPVQGVKAIAQKIQEQTRLESTELDQVDLAQPIPLSRRSESKVARIARQLAEAELHRAQMEKLISKCASGGKSPKLKQKQSSTSFINELLEMARAESVDKLNESSNESSAPDFKQSLLAARKKITQHEGEAKKAAKVAATVKQLSIPPTIHATVSASSLTSEGSTNPNVNEEIDPFVKEVLSSKTVPEPVKQKIRIECWSLFNDPRTPKGVKQCILATMLSKVQNE